MPHRTIFQENEEDTTLGGRISMAREASGLSVADVVKRLGVRANIKFHLFCLFGDGATKCFRQ